MSNQTPIYIVQRIRREIPKDCFVVVGSTPVVSFGNAHTARVATLGINPSKGEFLNKNNWLVGSKRRLATYESTGLSDLVNATDEQVHKILSDCYNYFNINPYRWFNDLDLLMKHAAGVSYYDGSACHLDLVQWATNPNWGELPRDVKKKLINSDKDFLIKQLQHEQIELVLLNGRSVIEQTEHIGVKYYKDYRTNISGINCRIVVGTGHGSRFIGWSTNLQSSHGVTKVFKTTLADIVLKEITKDSRPVS